MYYVYHLIDPRDGKPFYVGKGKGNRIEAHERQARLTGERLITSRKCNRIREIWAANLVVIREKVMHFGDEFAALAFEFRQIQSLPGLTNVHRYPGSRSTARIRRRTHKRCPAPRRECGSLRFTESLIARVAWIVVTSKGLKQEFTTDLVGATPLYKTIENVFNRLGYVKFATDAIQTWITQRGIETVQERFKAYGIDLVASLNTENC